INGFCGARVTLQVAGRTDSGVHALGQVAHFDLEREHPPDPETVRDAINAHLRPAPVAVLDVAVVDENFHARFSARQRVYLYRIVNRRAPLVLDRGRAWWVPAPLDAEAMAEAAWVLVGKHDFSSFRANACQANSPVKTLDALEVTRAGEEIWIVARARSFLYHQVRNMVGSLRLVGQGRWSPRDLERVLAARDRAAAGQTAPAQGLYFVEVIY
ncbi:MAG TPA: tRNA pseudouridine(38-40) synthase TruA, partial [Kiloniellales bacterium]|nr:tRNA pseudouridine(38-40) synthase TruA [Kiloniellales bacterium]